jgi:FtsP/CotA-like multicopper oxidase with cupredoxin domain
MRRFMVHLAVIALLTMAFSEFAPHPGRVDAVGFVPGTVPHYYGPYSNYANSPLKSSDAVLEFVGGGGNGAGGIATVNPSTGAITAVDITSGGMDYTSAPSVTVTSPVAGGTGASLTTAISKGVTNVTLTNPGHGYTAEPTVTVAGDGTGAVLNPHMSGFVASIEIGLPGGSYVSPVVTIGQPDEPGGVQATATAVATSGGITSVTVTNHGSGYTTDPDVFITDATGPGDGSAARALMTMDTISSLQIMETGRNYTAATISISAPSVAGTQATATATVSGAVVAVNVVAGGTGYVTPGGIKKFVDTLPGFGEANKNNLGQYIPVAVPDTTTYPGTDYYEIGLVQYREKMHTDIPATLLRGYVQLSTNVVPGKQVALTNANLNPLLTSSPVLLNGVQVQGVDNPHQYGPFIMATKDRPVRVLFRNLLPTGTAGDLFIPVDTTVMGSGMGPTGANMANPNPPVFDPISGRNLSGSLRPMCGETPKPVECYTENRATLHLHGGITPWISDGTPHQWITPATESTVYPKGVSVSNVPDMPDPGPGAQTFFYTNQQSARLLFYHDHSSGITRLNVYAGEAAGYLITDATEQKLIANGTLPSTQIPLILSDKTFVPNDTQMLDTDPTWNKAKWGGEGSLWMPHVYMPIQNPSQSSGTNDLGRWAYGPWFWPPTVGVAHGPIANPYFNPSCDTDVDPTCEPALIPGTPVVSMGMEAFNDTPLVNGTAYPTVTLQPKAYRFRVLNAADDRYFNLQLYQADATGTEVALKASEVAAAKLDPNVAPTPDTTKSPEGPRFIQVGTEGGFLPSPVIVPNQPITYVTDPARFDVGNVDQHALYIGPAERYDVVVDFSKWAGKTLILYNDAPAANPARDARYDYYTDNGDLTALGGAPTTLPGYGPNTRTVMQIKIATTSPSLAYNSSRLYRAFAHNTVDGSGVFESSQAPIIVGQGAYNAAYGTNFRYTAPFDGFARMTDGSLSFKTLANGAGGAALTIPLEMKAMHDEQGAAFDPEYGRMSGLMGLEDPLALTGAQNVYLYPYINPSTENFNGIELPPGVSVTPISSATDGTQIWKITHNGVDTHAMHWHLYDVQVINRVGWDGIIRPPGAHELGWKDTVKVAPLEDTIIAMRPIIPKLPFAVPDSIRVPDPTMPEGAVLNNVNVAAPTGMAAFTNINAKVNMGWEYVWHCHLLSHEEMDMMRPQQVSVTMAVPNAPVLSAWNGTTTFNWTDPTLAASIATWGDPGNEIGFRLERASVVNGVVSPYSVVARALANHTTADDTSVIGGQPYRYRVVAYNTAGERASNFLSVTYPVYVLSGRVLAGASGVTGATVTVYSANGVALGTSTTSTVGGVTGKYSFSLMPGSYKLYVQPNTTGYSAQWYGGANQAAATVVSLTADTPVNIALVGAPTISLSGRVTFTGGGANGQNASGARITVYDAVSGRPLQTVAANASGLYTVTLSSGVYKLYIQPMRTGYPIQWYGGAAIGSATPVTVTSAVTLNFTIHI